MKKVIFIALALCLVMAGSAFAAITGSSHDFQSASWDSKGEICAPCHTPHNANTVAVPLWAHDRTTATFTVYADINGTLDATINDPAGVSLACLSCHDGSVALESYIGAAGTSSDVIGGSANLDTNLTNDHPISFTYDSTLATTDGELHNPRATTSGLGANIDDDMLFSSTNDQMECASCHDAHNTAAVSKLLVKSNAASALCLTCHDK